MWFASKQPFVGRSVAFSGKHFPGLATISGPTAVFPRPALFSPHVKMTFGLVDVRYSLKGKL